MALVISDRKLQELVDLLHDSGVTQFELRWKGMQLVYLEGCEEAAGRAMARVLGVVRGVDSPTERKMLLDELERRFKKTAELAKPAEPGPPDLKARALH